MRRQPESRSAKAFGRNLEPTPVPETGCRELEMMVKSALQNLSDTNIHENPEPVNLITLLQDISQAANSVGQKVQLHFENEAMIPGKPLALRRCLENLIGNAVVYGDQARVYLTKETGLIVIRIQDQEPGLPEGMEEEIFKPYTPSAWPPTQPGWQWLGIDHG